MGDEPSLRAGDFGEWLADFWAAVSGEGDADVPCDGCTACCSSGQFVHVGPDEIDTLRHIPSELLVPAPGMPAGHVVMGYDERGCCPMLGERGCSIYEHRPQACRIYDCRVYPAAGVDVDVDKALLAARVRRWTFDYRTAQARQLHAAVRDAARSIAAGNGGDGRRPPMQPAAIAVRAVEFVGRQAVPPAQHA